MNIDVFHDWFSLTFLGELAQRRLHSAFNRHLSYHGEVQCQEHQMVALVLPPHSSNQLQPPDLSLLGVTKRLMRRLNRVSSLDVQIEHRVRVVNGFVRSATSQHIQQGAQNAGAA
jgi:hypothetical protein